MKVLALLLAVTRNPKSGMVNGSKLVVIFAILLLFQTTLVQASPLQTAETRRLQANAPCPAGTVNAYSDDHLTFRFQSDGITNQSGSLRWNAAVPANLGLAFTMTRPEDEQAYITFSPTRSATAPVPDYNQWLGDFVEPIVVEQRAGVPPGLLFEPDGVIEVGPDDGIGDAWKQIMYANKKIAVGAANTAFFIATPSAASTAYYGSLMGFRPGDAPGGQSWIMGTFGRPEGSDGCLSMLDWGSGYTGPTFRKGATVIVVFRSELAVDLLGNLAPVVSMAVIAADGRNTNGNAGGVEWHSQVYSAGMEEYARQGDLEEEFDIDMRNPETDGLRAFGAGYMGLGHWGLTWGTYDQFRGVIHHFEMHNATLTTEQTNDVISGLLPLINVTAPARRVCSDCAPGTIDHDNSPNTGCEDCAVGRFSETHGATVCAGTCALGSSIPVTGSSSVNDCAVCSAGAFGLASMGASICVPCPIGSSSAAIGADSAGTCVPCPVGESSGLGSTDCQLSGCTDAWATNYDPAAVVDEGGCTYSCPDMFLLAGGGSGTCVIFEVDSWIRYSSTGTSGTNIPGGASDTIPAGEHWIIQGRLKPGRTSAQPEFEQYGAVQATGVQLTMRYVTIDNAQSGRVLGAAVDAGGGTTSTVLTIEHAHFSRCEAYSGGAVSTADDTTVSFSAVSFADNVAEGRGGALVIDTSSAAVTSAVFTHNIAGRTGGAVSVTNGGSLALHTVVFLGNAAPVGGAIYVGPGGRAEIDSSAFQSNSAAARGGAVAMEQSTILLLNSTLLDNSAAGLGGALHISQPPSIMIKDTTFQPFGSGAGTVFIGGQLAGCDEHPCSLGFGCLYSQYSLACIPCSSTTVSVDGKACRSCEPGTGPTADSAACLPCVGNTVSTFGICEHCAPGFASNDAHTQCLDMSQGGLSDASIITEIFNTTHGGHLVAVAVSITFGDTEQDTLVDLATTAITAELGLSNTSIAVASVDTSESTHGQIIFMIVDQAEATVNTMMYGLTAALQPGSNSSLPLMLDRVSPTFGFVCPFGMVRLDGQAVCSKCPWPEFTSDQESCEECPLNMVPTETGDGCQCRENYFSTTNKDETEHLLTCYSIDFTPPLGNDNDLNLQCKACTGDAFECVSACRGLDASVTPGWQSLPVGDQGDHSIFACVSGEKACLGGPVDVTVCGAGFSGLLCNSCAPGFHDRSNTCVKCEDLSLAGAAATALGVAIVVLLALKVKVWYNYFTIFAEIADMVQTLELKAIFKQLTATIQILSALGPVLAVSFPDFFDNFLGGIAGFFKIDITVLFGLGCYGVTSYATSLFINFAAVGGLAILIIFLYQVQLWRLIKRVETPEEVREHALEMYEKFDKDGKGISSDEVKQIIMQFDPDVSDASIRTLFEHADTHGSGSIDFEEFLAAVNSPHTDEFSLDDVIQKKRQYDLRADALGHLFLLVFVMFPGLTNKIFEGFMCRDLGDVSVLHADYGTVCYTTEWYTIASVCGVLILLWPIGLPATLFFTMRRDLPLIQASDADTLKFWDFALGDYHVDHWYWEVVELSRKMIMAGLLCLFGRGTIIQVFIATCISFFFFAIALKTMPFESSALNVVKIFSEAQLFIILVSALVLQTDARGLASQVVGNRDHVGMMQAAVTLASFPLVVYVVGRHVLEQRQEAAELFNGNKKGDDLKTVNPMLSELDVNVDDK